MADIAAFVGVTKMRSRECCDTPNGCTPETRDLVRRIVNETGYVTNRLAGSLTVGCSGLVGAIVPTLRHSLFRRHDRRDDRRARRSGDSLIVANSRYQSDTEESQIRATLERRPDASVLAGLRHTPEARRLIEDGGVPVVETCERADAPKRHAGRIFQSRSDASDDSGAPREWLSQDRPRHGPSENNERARHRAEG
jgi:LacI family gluconate utilization system Gnt-I transcriptional repressor